MTKASEDGGSGLRISNNAQVASGTRRRWFCLSRAGFLAAFLLGVNAIRADETNAVSQGLCVEDGSTITNVAQLAAAFDQPGLTYPVIWPYEPQGMFEGQQTWWADFGQLPQEISDLPSYSGYEFHGVKFSALTLILDAATGAVTVKYPFSDTVLLQFDPPADYQPFQKYNQELEKWCQDSGRSPATFAELISNGSNYFLDPPELVLEVWVGSSADCAQYDANVAAEFAAEEMESEAPTPSRTNFSRNSSMPMDEEEEDSGFAESFAPGLITTLTQPFRITNIRRDTDSSTRITWESSPVFRYLVFYANELTMNTTWLPAAYVWGQANVTNLTSWTDTTTANVTARFYRVQRILGNPIAAGASHSLAALTNGFLFAWGSNGVYQLGLGLGSDHVEPVPSQVLGGGCMGFISNVLAVAGGGDYPGAANEEGYSIAVDSRGVVWTWGKNYYGQLGNGTEGTGSDQSAPAPITGISNVVSVAAGIAHALALRADGTVWGWGKNDLGQLGLGGSFPELADHPVQATVLNQIVAIAAGGHHGAALDQTGRVWTWGYNDKGQLGLGVGGNGAAPLSSNLPTQVTTISNVIAIAGGCRNTVALTSDKRVWTWSDNSFGQLGLGLGVGRLVFTNLPTLVPTISNVVAIAAGDGYSLAVTTNGFVYGWGNNWNGQLGVYTDMVTQTSNTMVVAGISNAVLVSAPPQETGSHSLAVTVEQGVTRYWGWGKSYSGQVGNGLTNESFSYSCGGGTDTCTSNNDSNVYAPAGPLEFHPACNQDIQLGTSGTFTPHCTGTLYLFLNDYDGFFGDNSNSVFSVMIDNGLGTNNVPGNLQTGVAIGTVSNGVTYTYTATGWCFHCSPGGVYDCPTDPNGRDQFLIKWDCSGRSPCTLICPEFQCFSLVGKIK